MSYAITVARVFHSEDVFTGPEVFKGLFELDSGLEEC